MPFVYVLQHVEPETIGTIALGLDAAGLETRTIRIHAGEPIPKRMDAAAGLIVMGGPMGVYEAERYPFLTEELHLIEHALQVEAPILGVCLGSQLLASALGARIAPAARKEIGWHTIALNQQAVDPLWATVEPSFVAFHWHGDQFTLPAGAIPLAASRQTPCQAYRYGSNAYGFLFHLEVTEEIVEGMVDAFAGELAEEGLDGERIVEGTQDYLPRLESMAEMVFGRWAALTLP